jgi:small redox-active disulfide protein 2
MTEKKIIVLGPGCPRCDKLTQLAGRAAEELGITYHLEKRTEFSEFQKYGLMLTPGLVVDGVLKVQGKVPSLDEIKAMLADG